MTHQETDTARSIGRRTQIAAAVVALLLLTGFVIVMVARTRATAALAARTESDNHAAPPVDVVTVAAAAGRTTLSLPGETAAWYASTIYARVNGYVEHWSVDIGDHVAAGQVLATIETPELDAELEAARAKLKAADADVQVREAAARYAETTYQRWKNSPKGVVSQQETEDKQSGAEAAAAQLLSARANVNLAQGEVDRLIAFQKFKDVVAPFAGIITERKIDIGNLVTAGSSSSTTPLYKLIQDDPIRIFTEVPQSVASAVRPGTPVDIALRGDQAQSYAGKVTRTADAVDPESRTLRVEIDLDNPGERLVPGLYVDTKIQIDGHGTAEVPAAALMILAKGPAVAVLDGDHVAFHAVTIARDDGNQVELASGVKPGDQAVLNISSVINDGDKVTIGERDGAPIPAQTAQR
jgi:RND family efflux transporter MFP subunit